MIECYCPLVCKLEWCYLIELIYYSSSCTGDSEQELGPPPSVDEAASTLMTRLGFLLGDKASEVQTNTEYSMDEQDENQVWIYKGKNNVNV